MKYKNLRKKIQIKIFKSSRTIVKKYYSEFFFCNYLFNYFILQFETLIMLVSR